MEYYEEHTYLVFNKKTNLPIRWSASGELQYHSNLEVAMWGLDTDLYEAKPISECSEELQKEYRKLIDNIL